ncbi:hypothetical protein RYA05_02775 [Pseudomonas syringae pv. actinidiae]|nr:hypothetical protein [Pseudomonas syringae pv. actinidiae]
MKKYLLALILAFAAVPAMACNISQSDLPEAMIQELKVKCEQMKLDMKTQPPAPVVAVSQITREDVSEWAQISQEFAKALGIAAREVGVSINEFLASPAGIMTAVVLIWMIIGKSLVAILVGLLITYATVKLNRRIWFRQVETVEKTGLFNRKYQKEMVRYNSWNDMNDSGLGWSIVTIIMLGVFWGLLVHMM